MCPSAPRVWSEPGGQKPVLSLSLDLIIWTNVDFSSHVFCGIHLRAMSQEMFVKLIRNMCPEMTLLWLLPHLSGASFINTLRPRQNGRHFADAIFKCILLNENAWISLEISLKFVPKVQINNINSIGSDNGMAPARRQAIIWTNDG